MQNNIALLTKQAIESALKGSWKEAIEINKQILECNANDIDAKARLGRAYLQGGEFAKAKKLFKEILEVDPINSIALKNYKLSKEKVAINNAEAQFDPKTLIREPGTSSCVELKVDTEKINITDFSSSQKLKTKATKNSVKFFKDNTLLGQVTRPNIIHGFQKAKAQNVKITANYVGSDKDTLKIILNSTKPVFKSKKQSIKPYLKKGAIEEPKLEIEATDEGTG